MIFHKLVSVSKVSKPSSCLLERGSLFNLAFQPVHFAVNMAAGETHKAEVCDQFNPQSKAAGPQAEMQTEKGEKKTQHTCENVLISPHGRAEASLQRPHSLEITALQANTDPSTEQRFPGTASL